MDSLSAIEKEYLQLYDTNKALDLEQRIKNAEGVKTVDKIKPEDVMKPKSYIDPMSMDDADYYKYLNETKLRLLKSKEEDEYQQAWNHRDYVLQIERNKDAAFESDLKERLEKANDLYIGLSEYTRKAKEKIDELKATLRLHKEALENTKEALQKVSNEKLASKAEEFMELLLSLFPCDMKSKNEGDTKDIYTYYTDKYQNGIKNSDAVMNEFQRYI
jgi:hypothetical protein